MTAVFALASALIVGASDFGGGLAARRAPALRVTVWVQVASFATLLVLVWFVEAPAVTRADLGWGLVAGTAGTFSFVSLYASFSRGQISVLAPISAIVGSVIPLMVGWARGESLSAAQWVGVLLALVAVVFVTQQRAADDGPASTPAVAYVLAFVAGFGFSIFFLALAETGEDAGLWPLVAARSLSVPLVMIVAVVVTKGIALPSAQARRITVAAGVGEALSNVFVLWAFQRGPITVAAVLSAFYPLSTVGLARIVLKERLRTVQWVGVALALSAIPLIALS